MTLQQKLEERRKELESILEDNNIKSLLEFGNVIINKYGRLKYSLSLIKKIWKEKGENK